MKILLDNNLSPYLAAALNSLSIADGVEVLHLTNAFAPATDDPVWIAALPSKGISAVVTQDRLLKTPFERRALRDAGVPAFVLARGWASLRHWEKSWRLVRWWPQIVDMVGRVEGGAVFVVPIKYTGRLRQGLP